ncbi:MAG TPA: Holliday junction resolvase RuvX [Candidatus Omnitrophota bacterium]|nr:Holliday junction resolvase RuvX [Candidatus Omnitrophota bacterium]HPS37447.1 Holliday junction resolvase RuvX [Candidatus Omnitrophota bacterium]
MGGVLGLDFGEKRIGVAFVAEGTTIAFPLTVIPNKGRGQVLQEIKKIVLEKKIGKIVAGLPVTMKGEVGIAAEKITKEVEWFRTQLAVPVVLWDERLSSKEVERVLIEADVRRDRRKEIIDQLAAQRILQNFIDSGANAPKE